MGPTPSPASAVKLQPECSAAAGVPWASRPGVPLSATAPFTTDRVEESDCTVSRYYELDPLVAWARNGSISPSRLLSSVACDCAFVFRPSAAFFEAGIIPVISAPLSSQDVIVFLHFLFSVSLLFLDSVSVSEGVPC